MADTGRKANGELAMSSSERDRVTVDLRGLGERLRTQAAARHMATGAFVRRAVALQLDPMASEPAGAVLLTGRPGEPVVKLTLRLSAAHAVALATRARQADASQGAYVAGLLDGSPPAPVPPDRADAIAALVASTDQLAALSADINAITRLLNRGKGAEAARYRSRLDDVSVEVRQHLKKAADLFSEVMPSRQARAGRAVRRSAHGRR
jgi:hypothetical protein